MDRLDDIVKAAVALFAKNGYHGTSITDITDAVGLGRGALYYHIKSKEDLLWECHSRHVEPVLSFALELEKSGLSAEEKLTALSRRLIKDIAEHKAEVTVFYREVGSLSPERFREAVQMRDTFEDVVGRILLQGAAEGIWDIPDVRMYVMAFLGLHNWTYQWFVPGGRLSAEEVSDIFLRIYLNGIVRPDSKKAQEDQHDS